MTVPLCFIYLIDGGRKTKSQAVAAAAGKIQSFQTFLTRCFVLAIISFCLFMMIGWKHLVIE